MRASIPFRSVNRRHAPDYDPGLQRHHLLPRQLLARSCFARLFDAIGRDRIGFDDFRRNGLLLPANDSSAIRMGLPLHRGPHRDYNAMVMERVGQIEGHWVRSGRACPRRALEEAHMRLALLQRALRRRLLDHTRRRIPLNRRDPVRNPADFADLDAMADLLWGATSAERIAQSFLVVAAPPRR